MDLQVSQEEQGPREMLELQALLDQVVILERVEHLETMETLVALEYE